MIEESPGIVYINLVYFSTIFEKNIPESLINSKNEFQKFNSYNSYMLTKS